MSFLKVDRVAPKIYLKGGKIDTCFINKSELYKDPGATAFDDRDGDISSSIKSQGFVYLREAGTYSVNYWVYDKTGNKASATRTIAVVNTHYFLQGKYSLTYTWTTFTSGNVTHTYSPEKPLGAGAGLSGVENGSFFFDPIYANGHLLSPFIPVTNKIKGDSIEMTITLSDPGFIFTSSKGVLAASKNSFTINIESYEKNYPQNSHRCVSVYSLIKE
ncbi:MAG: DUF5011 domain-containing protein [Bacteroidia bacterium]|nr:DUF5011 domain-containing protein [Bacteroidia bacterium]